MTLADMLFVVERAPAWRGSGVGLSVLKDGEHVTVEWSWTFDGQWELASGTGSSVDDAIANLLIERPQLARSIARKRQLLEEADSA